MAQKSGSAKSGASRSAKKAGASTSRQKISATRGEAFQSPSQREQVTGKAKGPGPVDRKAQSKAEDHANRVRVGREAKAQVQARGANETEANRVYQDAYDNPDKYDTPPPVGSDEEREFLEKLGKDQPGAGNEMTARYQAEKSGGRSSESSSKKKSRGKKSGKAEKQQATLSASAKAEAVGEKTATEGKGEPSI